MIRQTAKIQLKPAPKNPSRRARFILDTFTLDLEDGVYVARMWFQGRPTSTIEDDRIENVIAQARRRWGHQNFRDESEAFDTIFPPVRAL